ncbi:hypothetical protein ABZZ79_32500 [Streptomyces sp. NPDC006458]|uniref:hypothetical protein n=1 Tax=Streptomyces sp. NPDC006458 TaxID=3154302 RepID=UPI0033A726F7
MLATATVMAAFAAANAAAWEETVPARMLLGRPRAPAHAAVSAAVRRGLAFAKGTGVVGVGGVEGGEECLQGCFALGADKADALDDALADAVMDVDRIGAGCGAGLAQETGKMATGCGRDEGVGLLLSGYLQVGVDPVGSQVVVPHVRGDRSDQELQVLQGVCEPVQGDAAPAPVEPKKALLVDTLVDEIINELYGAEPGRTDASNVACDKLPAVKACDYGADTGFMCQYWGEHAKSGEPGYRTVQIKIGSKGYGYNFEEVEQRLPEPRPRPVPVDDSSALGKPPAWPRSTWPTPRQSPAARTGPATSPSAWARSPRSAR